jgi:hypothetical protein
MDYSNDFIHIFTGPVTRQLANSVDLIGLLYSLVNDQQPTNKTRTSKVVDDGKRHTRVLAWLEMLLPGKAQSLHSATLCLVPSR